MADGEGKVDLRTQPILRNHESDLRFQYVSAKFPGKYSAITSKNHALVFTKISINSDFDPFGAVIIYQLLLLPKFPVLIPSGNSLGGLSELSLQ
jgi:hypothetical protein